MNFESIVTSLELSKKLKEIGLPQESLFYWYQKGSWWRVSQIDLKSVVIFPEENREYISAFTAQEIIKYWPYQNLTFDVKSHENIATLIAFFICQKIDIGEFKFCNNKINIQYELGELEIDK